MKSFKGNLNTQIKKITSVLDESVNFIVPFKESLIECRYVRREPEYISTYLSSHNGCVMNCKFCWLTATNQTKFNHVSIDEYAFQLNKVLEYAKEIDKEKSKTVRININLMARGEPLANKYIINEYNSFDSKMRKIVSDYDYLETKINISTIMPKVIGNHNLTDIFGDKRVNLYYSLYSINDKFRKKWIPMSINWESALQKLYKFQRDTDNIITFHYAVIENENDDIEETKKMAQIIKDMNFKKTKFNLVRFNPHPSMQYKEPPFDKLKHIHEILQSVCNDAEIKTHKSRIVDRIGPDVYASCGMFCD